MNLDMFRSRYGTEALLLSATENYEILIKKTHTKPEKTLEFKLTKPKETFSFNPPTPVEGSWMIG